MNWIALSLLSMLLLGLGNFFLRMSSVAGQGAVAAMLISFVAQLGLGCLFFFLLRPQLNGSILALSWPVLAGLLLGGGVLCLITAMAKPGAQAGVPVAIISTNFLLVSALAWIILGQPLTLKQLVGFAVILGGLVLII